MSESLEEIQSRHRKELRDLTSKTTQKKKQATKKTRKGVNDECASLELQLRERQAAELAALTGGGGEATPDLISDNDENEEEDGLDGVAEKLSSTTIADKSPEQNDEPAQKGPKRNRQKERLARRAAEQEAEAQKAEAEALLQPNWKKQERTAMLSAFASHSLSEKEIRADGHCLYSAIADQLVQQGVDIGAQNEAEKSETFRYKPIRRAAAMYILDHRSEFEGFLEEPIISYVSKIERTAEWGGHLELVALAKNFKVEINVIQDGTTNKFSPGEDVKDPKKIWLAYYHHGYGLGEHYNSLRAAKTTVVGEKGEESAP